MKLFFILCAFLFGAILTHADGEGKKHVGANDGRSGLESNGTISESNAPRTPDLRPTDPNLASHTEEPGPKTDDNKSSPKTPSEKQLVSSTQPSSTTTTAAPINPTDKAGDWNVTENHKTCIKVHGIISLSLTVPNSTVHNKTVTFKIDISPQITAAGSCKNETIRWNLDPEGKESLAFQFTSNESSKEFYLSRVDGQFYYPNSNKTALIGFKNDSLKAFITPLEKSYLCRDLVEEHIKHSNNTNIVLTLKDFQIQAFKSSKSNGFDESIDGCPSHGGTPDMVPIIVGCALALLVVIVLVAYLINRRRSQAHGYLSM